MQGSLRKFHIAFFGAAAVLLLMIACSEHGLEPVSDSFISGKITYVGGVAAWPDSTEWVRLAAFTRLPRSTTEILLNPPTFSDTLPRFVASYDYTLKVPAGRYEWIVLAWKPRLANPANPQFSGLDTLGFYLNPTDSTKFGIVDVAEGQTAAGIDIIADFARLTPPSPIVNKQNAKVIAWHEQ